MIGAIDYQQDISIYLSPEEIEKLPNNVLEGVIIRTAHPKQQGLGKLSINPSRENENGSGIGINNTPKYFKRNNFEIEIFMGDWAYKYFQKNGVIGLRHKMKDGSKIDIYNTSVKNITLDPFFVKDLEEYRDDRENLPDDLGWTPFSPPI